MRKNNQQTTMLLMAVLSLSNPSLKLLKVLMIQWTDGRNHKQTSGLKGFITRNERRSFFLQVTFHISTQSFQRSMTSPRDVTEKNAKYYLVNSIYNRILLIRPVCPLVNIVGTSSIGQRPVYCLGHGNSKMKPQPYADHSRLRLLVN